MPQSDVLSRKSVMFACVIVTTAVYTGTTGGDTGGNYSEGNILFSSLVYGTKISMLKFSDYKAYTGDNTIKPALGEGMQMPTSVKVGESTAPSSTTGAYPIYFVTNQGDNTKEELYFADTSGGNRTVKAIDDKYIVKSTPSSLSSGEISAFATFNKAFNVDWTVKG